MRERTLERYFVRETNRRGGVALKLVPANLVGFPDRTVLGPNASLGFAELKTPNGKVSKAQQWWLNKLRRYGFIAEVIRSSDETQVFLDRVLQ